jgi:hypothetical protein|tara:strand:+ start:4233 stop:4394 length:162 start_codon:yes stop_codon:yes gene_type:complete
MIGFILFTPMFFAWWIILGLAEANYRLPKNLTRYTGVDMFRGKQHYTAEDYYG